MRGGSPVADVAVLATPGNVGWRAARALFESQIDFYYLDESLLERCRVSDGRVRVGQGSYKAILLDGMESVPASVAGSLLRWLEGGVKVVSLQSPVRLHPLRRDSGGAPKGLLDSVFSHANYSAADSEAELVSKLRGMLEADLEVRPAAPDLRFTHRVKDGVHFYLITNEGQGRIRATASFRQKTLPEFWNAETGEAVRAAGAKLSGGRVEVGIDLYPENSLIGVFDPGGAQRAPTGRGPSKEEAIDLPEGRWKLTAGGRTFEGVATGTWTGLEAMEKFSGTGWYEREVEIPREALAKGARLFLDCGEVREWAQLEVNGKPAGARLWSPFRFEITGPARPGRNTIRLGVTNTPSNELTRKQLPSGLAGPVRLIVLR